MVIVLSRPVSGKEHGENASSLDTVPILRVRCPAKNRVKMLHLLIWSLSCRVRCPAKNRVKTLHLLIQSLSCRVRCPAKNMVKTLHLLIQSLSCRVRCPAKNMVKTLHLLIGSLSCFSIQGRQDLMQKTVQPHHF